MTRFQRRLLVLALLFLAITGAILYGTTNAEALQHLANFKPVALLWVVSCWLLGMAFDGLRLMHLVQIAGEKISFHQALQVVFGNYFMALLTPGAAGGAVAQVMFLNKAGVSAGKSAILVLIRTLLSILFLVLMLPWALLAQADVLAGFDLAISTSDLLWWLTGLTVLMAAGLAFLTTRASFRVLFWFLRALRFGLRYKIMHFYQDVRSGWLMLLRRPGWLIVVFAESAFSLWFLYSLVPALFWGFTDSLDYQQVMGRMIVLNFVLYFAPTPGGSGIAEGGFVMLFENFVPSGTVGIVAVAWRVIAEYIPFAIGMFYAMKVFGAKYFAHSVK